MKIKLEVGKQNIPNKNLKDLPIATVGALFLKTTPLSTKNMTDSENDTFSAPPVTNLVGPLPH